ncbi:histidine phosphatase family protein [Natronomonas sp.]|uniref:histidine phosphatase family protein n=1 Tax=Natronomonas sp. TaxID=2184060 RepID=UPI0026356909|nr:histidine phosphatase family protein [Natronomonas sp.]
MTRVVAVRHGETDWNRNGRMQGWAPVPLNGTGREQATALGESLAEEYAFDRVVSSDLLRAEETTERVLESVGSVPVSAEAAWRERDLGVYQGLTREDVEARFPAFGLGETAYEATEAVPEGGESFRDVERRVVGRFEELAAATGTVLLVTHGGPLCILAGHAKGQGLTDALSTHHFGNCSVTEFDVGGAPRVLREDASAWRET